MEGHLYFQVKQARTPKSNLLDLKIKDMFSRISKIYEDGCQEFYKNEWSDKFKQMEDSLLQDSDTLKQYKLIWFERTITDYISIFKNLRAKQKAMGFE